ncbi:hypothetical protein ACEPAF_1788 [Sanghuangporus sanghuang]
MELVALPQSFPTFLAAAAQVLSTYDIFERIVCLDVLDRQDMINCAVVCRSWSDLALNGLWSHSSFDDLLHIFPSIAKTHKQDGELEWSIGNISIAHWDRFLHYSKRVNTLEATCSIPDLLIWEISFSRPGIALFPRLKKVLWQADRSSTDNWIKFSRIFLHANLSDLAVSPDVNKDESIADFISELPTRTPYLSSLHVEIPPVQTQAISTYLFRTRLKDTLLLLPNLVILSLHYEMTSSDIGMIAKLPKLRTLSLGLALKKRSKNFAWWCNVENPFPSLTSLEIIRGRIRGIDQLLDAITNKHALTALTVSVVDFTELALETFIQNLQSTCPALEHLSLRQDKLDRPAFASFFEWSLGSIPSLPRTMLELLKGFQQLKSLHIVYYRSSDMTDDDFMELVGALPNLIALKLICIPTTTEHPALTLKVLHRLAHFYRDRLNHSRLTNLHLQINASTWPDETVDALLSSAETYELDSLDVLSLSASPMSSVDDTALYLNHMIPSSAKLITDALDEECLPLGSTPEGNENHAEDVKEMEDRKAKWSEVCKRVKGFRRVQAVLAKRRAQSRADMRLPN